MTTEAQRRLYQGPRAHKAKLEITPGVVRTAFSWRPLSRSVCERCQQKLGNPPTKAALTRIFGT
jgi:hypothetical protein